jgi:hypothetical protein
MNGPRRFNPSELLGGSEAPASEAELADAFATARVLESHASADRIGPSEGFEDRVMAAIATEPAPRVVLRPGPAVRGGRPAAFLIALRDAWAIATGQGRPMVVRAQALGFLLLVVVAIGSLGTVTAVGVGSLLQPQPTPVSSVAPISTATPSAEPSSSAPSSPGPSIEPSPSPTATETAEPTEMAEPTGTGGATETPEGTDDRGGASSTETPGSTRTPKPEDTPKPGETLKPGETPRSSDDNGGGGSNG